MDASKFTHPTGELVEIERADHPTRKDWAFIPSDLPPKWEFDNRLYPLLIEARERLGELNGIGRTLDDPELLLQPLQNREAITSSQIEGTFVTPEQLLLFEMDPSEATQASEPKAAWREVLNYNDAMNAGLQMISNRPIGNHVIRSMHSVLMTGVRGRDASPGKFRTRQVQIGSSARYIPPPCTEVDRLMTNLEEYIQSTDKLDPLVRCFIVHCQFESIHPFEDGNGRVGRVLLALMIYKLLGHHSPWLYLSAYFDRFQDEYFSNMFQVSTTGSWSQWVEFCLRATVSQSNDAIRRCERFRQLRISFHERVVSPTPRSHQLIDRLFRTPIVRPSSISKNMSIHYNTASADIDKLVTVGILKELAGLRPKTFYSPEIMDIAYETDR